MMIIQSELESATVFKLEIRLLVETLRKNIVFYETNLLPKDFLKGSLGSAPGPICTIQMSVKSD